MGQHRQAVDARWPRCPPVPSRCGAIARMGRLVQADHQGRAGRLSSSATSTRRSRPGAGRRSGRCIYTSLFRELLTYMMEDPRKITACTHLLFIAKNLERIGDHATNIAETSISWSSASADHRARPKGDESSFTVVTPRPTPCKRRALKDELMNSAPETLVLIVEDEAALVSLLRYNLEQEGFRVVVGRSTARRRCCSVAEQRARPGPARLDAAADVGHRGLPPAAPPDRDRATCRSSC